MMKPTMEFDTSFETGAIIPKQVGRLILGDGYVARLLLMPDGLRLFIPKAALKHGVVVFSDQGPYKTLGKLPKRRNELRNFPYGNCGCSVGLFGHCCKGAGPAAFEAERDGKKIRLCTKCDLSSDKNKVLLVKPSDDKKIFIDYDGLADVWVEEE